MVRQFQNIETIHDSKNQKIRRKSRRLKKRKNKMTDREKTLTITKKLVRSLLLPNKDGLALNALGIRYQEIEGRLVPFKQLGYASLELFLRSIPDTARLEKGTTGLIMAKAVVDENTRHIANLVRDQRSNSAGPNRGKARFNAGSRFTSHPKSYVKSRVPPVQLINEVLALMKLNREGVELGGFDRLFQEQYKRPMNYQICGFTDVSQVLSAMLDIVDVRQTSGGVFKVFPRPQRLMEWHLEETKHKNATKEPDLPVTQSKTGGRDPPPISMEVRNNLVKLIGQHAKGITVTHFLEKYKETYAKSLDYNAYGCQSMAQFCILLNTIFRIHKPRPDPKEDWWVYPLDGELKVTKGNEENEVSPKLTSVNTTLFNKNDEHLRDVNKDELEAVRKMEESCVVIVSNLAETVTTDDLETLFRYHGDVICCNIHYNGSGQVVLNNEDNARRAVEEFEGQRLDDKELHCELAVSSKSNTNNTCAKGSAGKSQSSPTAIDHPNFPIQQQLLPPDINIGDSIDVLVGQVINPNNFWIQLKANFNALNLLMDALEEFYKAGKGLSHTFAISQEAVVEGAYCAALFDNAWHRAIITDKNEPDNVEVMYFDYGTTEWISRANLRHLHKDYALLPAQAIRCRLASIRPILGVREWSQEAGEEFLRLVMKTGEEGLVAMVRGYSKPHNAISVWLYDTISNDLPEGIQINDYLVQLGLAESFSAEFNETEILESSLERALNRKSSARPPKQQTTHSTMPLRRPQQADGVKQLVDGLSPLPAFPSSEDDEAMESMSDSPFSPIKKAISATIASAAHYIYKPQSSISSSLPKTLVRTVFFDPRKNALKAFKLPPKHVVHMVKVGGEIFMMSAEISSLVAKWRNKDVLAKMLELKKASISPIVVSRDASVQLFEQCILEGVQGMDDQNHIVDQLTLYAMTDVPSILHMFCRSSESVQLIKVLESELANFDKNDEHWTKNIQDVD